METIEVLYHGDLSEDALRYVESIGRAKVLDICPLVIAAREDANDLTGLLGAISLSPMKVELVKVRRSGRNQTS